MDKGRKGDEHQSGEVEPSNVIPFVPALVAKAAAPEAFFTDAERREIREMLAYYRIARPQFEAIKFACPTARNLLGDEE